MEELTYTSAAQGLMPGSSGFCTVEMTEGMPTETMDALESLSAYDQNPAGTINWMHLRIETIRGPRHVLSRVAPMRGEFSGRSNKLASHLCVAPGELQPQGPMLFLGSGGPLKTGWSGNVGRLPAKHSATPLRMPSTPRPCQSWATAAGDAGVAGAVLGRLLGSDRPLYVMRTAAMDALAMTDEMLALLSGPDRWGITFATYLHTMPRSAQCQLRWVVEGSPAAAQAQSLGSDVMIDLRRGAAAILAGADAKIVEAARRGAPVSRSSSSFTANAVDRSTQTPSGVRRKAESSADLRDAEYASAAARVSGPPMPLPPEPTGTPALKWWLIGLVALMIPLCGVIIFLAAHEPAEVAALHELKQAQQRTAKIEPPSVPEKEEIMVPVVEPKEEPKTERPKRNRKKEKPAEPEQPKGPKSEIPQTVDCEIELPTSALSLSRNEQTLCQGVDIYDVTLASVAVSADRTVYELAEPDVSGFRDIRSKNQGGESIKLASLLIEPDRVLFAWSPTTKSDRAAAFAISHTFLVKDDTHHSTIQFKFAKPIEIEAPSVPSRKKDYAVPIWLAAEHELSVKASFRSATTENPLELPRLRVTPVGAPAETQSKSVDIGSLEDLSIRSAEFFAEATLIGANRDRKLVFASELSIRGDGIGPFLWRDRIGRIREHTEQVNAPELQKKPTERRLSSAPDRIEKLDQWHSGLECELEFYAKVGEREILWAKTIPTAAKGDSQ